MQKPKFLAWFDHFFDWLTERYVRIATILIVRKKLTIAIWIAVVISTLGMFKMVPMGFVPIEDQGLLFATVNLPSASGLAQTKVVVDQMTEKLTKNSAIDSVLTVTGFDFLDFGNQKTYAASFFYCPKRLGFT